MYQHSTVVKKTKKDVFIGNDKNYENIYLCIMSANVIQNFILNLIFTVICGYLSKREFKRLSMDVFTSLFINLQGTL